MPDGSSEVITPDLQNQAAGIESVMTSQSTPPVGTRITVHPVAGNGQKTGTLGEVQGVGLVVTYGRDLPNELYDPARMHPEGERCPRCR
jgi:hypothetical protein